MDGQVARQQAPEGTTTTTNQRHIVARRSVARIAAGYRRKLRLRPPSTPVSSGDKMVTRTVEVAQLAAELTALGTDAEEHVRAEVAFRG
jgi:hypothetical protein